MSSIVEPPSDKDPARERYAIVAFWILFSAFWLWSLGSRALMSPDEGRYAALSLNVLTTGDWVTPRLNGLLYFEKPPLQYWIGAIFLKLFGVDEFAVRLWPGLAGLGTIGLIGVTAHRLWGREAGLLSAAATGGMAWIVANSHFLSLDMGLTFWSTLTLCGLTLGVFGPSDGGSRWSRAAWVGAAGAMLSKGLIGIVIPAAAVILFALIERRRIPLRRTAPVSGPAIFLLLTAPWLVLVSIRNPDFLDFFIVREHFQRYLTTEHHRVGPIWYFVPVLLGGLMPWTTLLPRTVRAAWRREADGTGDIRRLHLIWAGFVFVFFSLSGSKLTSYILPMFPALGLIAGRTLARMSSRDLRPHLLPTLALGIAIVIAYPFVGRLFPALDADRLDRFADGLAIAALILIVSIAAALWLLARDRKRWAVMLTAFAVSGAVGVGAVGFEGFARERSAKEIAPLIDAALDRNDPIFTVRYLDQTLPFYLGREVILVDYVDEFDFGERAEPERWIPDINGFLERWRRAPRAGAITFPAQYRHFVEAGVPMRVIHEDRRRVVVVKP